MDAAADIMLLPAMLGTDGRDAKDALKLPHVEAAVAVVGVPNGPWKVANELTVHVVIVLHVQVHVQ